MNNLFNNYDSENDERLDKKFSYNYQVIKNVYPKVSELPEDEVREIIRKYYDTTGTHEESMQAVMNYIHEKEPEWKRLYFKGETLDNGSRIQPITESQKKEAEALARQIRPEMPNMFTDNMAQDTADMVYGAGRAINGMTGSGLDYLGDKYGIDTRMSGYLTQKDEEGTGELVRHLGNRALMADYKEIVKNIMKKAYEDYPVVKIGDAAGTLHAAKKEMDKANLINSDNYYHRLGMCLNGQKGLDSAIYSLGWGLLKEGYDIARKTYNGNNLADTLTDSFKDMQNNVEGLRYGLTNPDKSCRIWLNDLDINTNSWKNR